MTNDRESFDELHRFAIFEPRAHALYERAAERAGRLLSCEQLIVAIGCHTRLHARAFEASGRVIAAPELDIVRRVAETGTPDEGPIRGLWTDPRTCLAVPLRAGTEGVGVLAVTAEAPRTWTGRDHEALIVLADWLVEVLEVEVELLRRSRNESHLSSQKDVLGMIARGAPLTSTMAALARHVEQRTPGSLCAIRLRDESGDLELVTEPVLSGEWLDGAVEATASQVAVLTVAAGEPLIVADADAPVTGTEAFCATLRAHDFRACWSAPLLENGVPAGTLEVYRSAPGAPDHQERELLTVAAAMAGIALDRMADERTLRRSAEYFRSLIENSAELTLVLDGEGLTRYASPSATDALGLEEGSEFGSALDPAGYAHVRDVLEGLGSQEDVLSFEFRTSESLGGRRFTAVAANLLSNAAVRGVVINAQDVTHRHDLEEQLRQSQRIEAVGRLAGGVAHDFNNLLTAMTGFVELLREHMDSADDEGHAHLEEIRRGADRASALTRQLLAFSRRQVLQPRRIDPAAVVRGVEPMLRRLISETIAVETDLEPNTPWVCADAGQLEQVIVNLAVNARDAMPGGGRLTIGTAGVTVAPGERPDLAAGSYVRITVEDTGHGIEPAILPKVFDPFFTTKQASSGTGLGLSTVHGIVKQSSGEVQVSSEPGRGSRFSVYLPAVEAEQTREEPPTTATTSLRRASAQVLIVEDHEAVRNLARRILERAGYEVTAVEDGTSALALLESDAPAPDILLTDVVLPGMSGPALAARVARTHPDTAIIFMSGYADDHLGEQGIVDAEVAFLQKPFTPGALTEIVATAWKRESEPDRARGPVCGEYVA